MGRSSVIHALTLCRQLHVTLTRYPFHFPVAVLRTRNVCADVLLVVAGLAPNSGLLGTTPEDAALVEQWVHFGDTEVAVLQDTVYAMIHNYLPYSKPVSHPLATILFKLSDLLHTAPYSHR
jgi:hypothetical protein